MKRAIVLLALVAAGCSAYTPPPLPSPSTTGSSTPARLVLTASSRPDQQVDVTAQVLSGSGQGVPNIAVTFVIGSGSIAPATAMTDATGNAKTLAQSTAPTTIGASIAGGMSESVSVLTSTPALAAMLSAAPVVIGAASSLHAIVTGSPIGGPFTYAWTFGDSTSDTGSADTIQHVYAATGMYAATVRVTDGSGRSATSSAAIVVNPVPSPPPPPPPPPAPTLTAVVTCSPLTPPGLTSCNVTASFGGAALASGEITNVDWDWGDGTAITHGTIAQHSYFQVGSYTVVATVTATTSAGSKTVTTSLPIVVK